MNIKKNNILCFIFKNDCAKQKFQYCKNVMHCNSCMFLEFEVTIDLRFQIPFTINDVLIGNDDIKSTNNYLSVP